MKSKKGQSYFTPGIDKYFADWILKTTWWTDNLYDEERFHAFVLAVHKLSKQVAAGKHKGRNPRTYDKKKFKATIIDAVKRNHPGFDEEHLEGSATEYANTAMVVLEFLWQTRHGLPDLTDWNAPLR